MAKKGMLSENALEVAQARYFMNGENWEDCCARVANTVSACESVDRMSYTDSFAEMIHDMYFLPGGRILRNAGRPRGSLFNCYHLPIGDSIEEIGQFYKDALTLWSEGGGVGCNFSPLRPKNDAIHGKGGHSSGLVSFMEGADFISRMIESGGSRRAAAIGHIDVSHPEVMDFIDAKLVHGRLSHFNISVSINDDFLVAVERGDDWEFKFNQKSYGKLPARTIWNKIVENMTECAEPGLLNWSKFQKNNSYYFEPVLGTNPCGETTLGAYGACDLGSLVLPNFITGTVNTNWVKLRETIKIAVRFLDNIIEVNKYVLPKIDISAHNSRRIGVGVVGLAEYLFAKKLRYGSSKSIFEVERLMKFIRDEVYQSSVELATEKGSFPKFDPILYSKSSFVRKLPNRLKMDIKNHGIRNTTLLAIAPTGTISLLADVTSSIEPLFSKAHIRKDRVSERLYIHPLYEKFLKEGYDAPEWFVDSGDLNPEDHLEIQRAVQTFVDGSVSKTINLPSETTSEDLSRLLLEYMYDLKGVTVYRDGSREGQPLNKMSHLEVIAYLNKGNSENHFEESDVSCSIGGCE